MDQPSAAVLARIELDERISLKCGVARDDGLEVRDEDLDLLLRITHERCCHLDGRREAAAVALGTLARRGEPSAAARLAELALDAIEDEGVRVRALAGLPRTQRQEFGKLLADDPSVLVRDYASRLT